jgi:hypothetical protein
MNTTKLSKAQIVNVPIRGDIDLGVRFDDGLKGIGVYVGKESILKIKTDVAPSISNVVYFDTGEIEGFNICEEFDTDINSRRGRLLGDSFLKNLDSSKCFINEVDALSADNIESISFYSNDKIRLQLKDMSLESVTSIQIAFNVVHYRLMFISNLVTYLLREISASSDGFIYLNTKTALPYSGKIRIDYDEITYNSLTVEGSSADFPEGCFKLGGITRSDPLAVHPIGSMVILSLLDDNNTLGRLPKKNLVVYEKSNNLGQYYHFDSNYSSDSIIDMSPSVNRYNAHRIGSISLIQSDIFLKSAAKFTKSGILLTRYSFGNNGSIHFYMKMDTLPNSDMVVFGNKNSLWCKVNKSNLRLSIGYGSTILISNENPKLSKLKVGEWTEITIVWLRSNIYLTDRLYLYNNGMLEIDEQLNQSFSSSYFAIGGLLTSEIIPEELDLANIQYDTPFEGYIDDWRIYDEAFSQDQILDLDQNLKKLGFEYYGIIKIDKKFVNPVTNKILDYKKYYEYNPKNDPYILTYFSVLKSDEEKLDSLGEYGSTCELWPIYTLDNGNMFTTDMVDYIYSDEEKIFGAYVNENDTIIPRLCYPVNVNSIKYRLSLVGKTDGKSSPVVKDFVTIISASTLDFYSE